MEKEHTNQGTRQGIRFHSIVFLLFAQTDIYAGEGRANDQEKKRRHGKPITCHNTITHTV